MEEADKNSYFLQLSFHTCTCSSIRFLFLLVFVPFFKSSWYFGCFIDISWIKIEKIISRINNPPIVAAPVDIIIIRETVEID